MHLRTDALRFVLAQGLPATLGVAGRSMEPTITLGARVAVEGLAATAPLAAGDVVLLATSEDDVLLLHRVMHAFVDGGRSFVVHQGDARRATFGVCARQDVLALMSGFAADDAGGARPPPMLERLDVTARARFARRRVACLAFVGARRASRALGVAERPLVRLCARAFRRLAGALAG